jgi:hypothetical protein
MGKTHDMLYREAIDIAKIADESLADVYGTLSVAERALVDSLDDFNARVLGVVDGYEQEVTTLRESAVTDAERIACLETELDGAVDDMIAHRDGHNKFRRMWEKNDKLLTAIGTIANLK